MEESSRLSDEHLSHPLVKQFAAYWDDHNAAATASGLIHFGYGQFRRARLIAKLELLKKIHRVGNRSELQREIHEFAMEGVIDAVRICICFENFMKARLLANGYLVHEIDKGQVSLKDLAKNQHEQPIRLREVVEACGGWKKTREGLAYLDGVKKQTLKMNRLLGHGYQQIIALPKDVLAYLVEANSKRNQLHFYFEDGFSTSKETIASLEKLIGFVRGPMTSMHDSLILSYGLPRRFLIDHNVD